MTYEIGKELVLVEIIICKVELAELGMIFKAGAQCLEILCKASNFCQLQLRKRFHAAKAPQYIVHVALVNLNFGEFYKLNLEI